MKIIVQKCPDLHAFLIDSHGKIKASSHGSTDLEAIGRPGYQQPEQIPTGRGIGQKQVNSRAHRLVSPVPRQLSLPKPALPGFLFFLIPES
ncbi:MAG: hypothetical protein Q7S34_02950 [bacterium]|nr:hypothetical protein [bacterium]